MKIDSLPSGYREIRRIDLKQDKKLMLLVTGLSLLILAAMVVPAFVARGGICFYGGAPASVKLVVFAAALVGYVVLHELTHGVFIRLLGGVKPEYGFSLMYAYAGSTKAYFKKWPYLVIAMAPVVIWGCVLLALQFVVSDSWWWVAYMIQVMNVSGAAGDFYVAVLLPRMPEDTLIQDTGVAMTFYSREGAR